MDRIRAEANKKEVTLKYSELEKFARIRESKSVRTLQQYNKEKEEIFRRQCVVMKQRAVFPPDDIEDDDRLIENRKTRAEEEELERQRRRLVLVEARKSKLQLEREQDRRDRDAWLNELNTKKAPPRKTKIKRTRKVQVVRVTKTWLDPESQMIRTLQVDVQDPLLVQTFVQDQLHNTKRFQELYHSTLSPEVVESLAAAAALRAHMKEEKKISITRLALFMGVHKVSFLLCLFLFPPSICKLSLFAT